MKNLSKSFKYTFFIFLLFSIFSIATSVSAVNPTVNVTANPASISCNGSSAISWSSTNADSCELSGGGLFEDAYLSHGGYPTGNLTTTTDYTVTCSKNPTTVASSCSGTYQTDPSYCGILNVEGSYCNDGGGPGPYEDQDCSGFTTSTSCQDPSNPWCTHPCTWQTRPLVTNQCSDFDNNGADCQAQSSCTWNPETVQTYTDATDTATVTVTCSENVDIYDPNVPPPGNGPYYVHTGSKKSLEICGEGIDGKECELFKDGISLVENGLINPWTYNGIKSFNTNAEINLLSRRYKVNCDNGNAVDNETVKIIDPDLIIPINSSIVFYPENPVENTSVDMYALIANEGNYSTVNPFPNFFQVSDVPGLDPSTQDLTPSITIGPLNNGGNQTIDINHTFTSAGTYYVRACADKANRNDTGDIHESNEGNNCGNWTAVTVSALPDLVASKPVPTTAGQGIATTFFSTITNQGNSSTGITFSNEFQTATGFDDNGYPLGAAYYVGYPNPMQTLGAGTSAVTNRSITFPYSGTYYMRVCADRPIVSPAPGITESNEGNNCSSWQTIVVSPNSSLPDLIASL